MRRITEEIGDEERNDLTNWVRPADHVLIRRRAAAKIVLHEFVQWHELDCAQRDANESHRSDEEPDAPRDLDRTRVYADWRGYFISAFIRPFDFAQGMVCPHPRNPAPCRIKPSDDKHVHRNLDVPRKKLNAEKNRAE